METGKFIAPGRVYAKFSYSKPMSEQICHSRNEKYRHTIEESEQIVNYPERWRIIGLLMIIGNMGLVTVLATLVASLVQTEGA